MPNIIEMVAGSEATNNWLLTTAIGGDYLPRWRTTAAPSWIDYAGRHDLGIAVIVGDIHRPGEPKLNGAWQKMLAPRALRDLLGRDVRCALLDTDLFIAPGAESVFDQVDIGNFGVVSEIRGLPLPVKRLTQRVAFLRRRFRDPEFPLESLLNADPRKVFEWAGLAPHDDYFCTGMIVCDTTSHADRLAEWYRSSPQAEEYHRIGAWEEVWLNHCIQSSADVAVLDYSWHALWIYEVAANYPFLYSEDCPPEVAQWCLAASLMRNRFVHLAGRWESSLLVESSPLFPGEPFVPLGHQLSAEERTTRRAANLGTLRPPTSGSHAR